MTPSNARAKQESTPIYSPKQMTPVDARSGPQSCRSQRPQQKIKRGKAHVSKLHPPWSSDVAPVLLILELNRPELKANEMVANRNGHGNCQTKKQSYHSTDAESSAGDKHPGSVMRRQCRCYPSTPAGVIDTTNPTSTQICRRKAKMKIGHDLSYGVCLCYKMTQSLITGKCSSVQNAWLDETMPQQI